METEKIAEGRFSYGVIHQYLRDGSYPDSYTKTEKQALWKRSKYFGCKGADLFYVGGS